VLTVDFSRFPLAPGDRVLDLGCGAGRHAFECYRRGAQVVALDQNGEEIREVAKWFAAMKEAGEAPAGATATAMEGDALALPFPDESFDVVIISEVMEHIPDDKGVLAEMVRNMTAHRAAVSSWNRSTCRSTYRSRSSLISSTGRSIRIRATRSRVASSKRLPRGASG